MFLLLILPVLLACLALLAAAFADIAQRSQMATAPAPKKLGAARGRLATTAFAARYLPGVNYVGESHYVITQ
jgi:hypothetical protein